MFKLGLSARVPAAVKEVMGASSRRGPGTAQLHDPQAGLPAQSPKPRNFSEGAGQKQLTTAATFTQKPIKTNTANLAAVIGFIGKALSRMTHF